MQVIIVTGIPATGKTTIAKRIVSELGYNLISKDEIKEHLFETDGRKPNLVNWKYYEDKSIKILYQKTSELLNLKTPLVIESNFHKSDIKELKKVLEGFPCKEIYCQSNSWVIFYRAIRRKEVQGRHAGHLDRIFYPLGLLNALLPFIGKLDNPHFKFINKRLIINTTKFSNVNYAKIIDFVRDQ